MMMMRKSFAPHKTTFFHTPKTSLFGFHQNYCVQKVVSLCQSLSVVRQLWSSSLPLANLCIHFYSLTFHNSKIYIRESHSTKPPTCVHVYHCYYFQTTTSALTISDIKWPIQTWVIVWTGGTRSSLNFPVSHFTLQVSRPCITLEPAYLWEGSETYVISNIRLYCDSAGASYKFIQSHDGWKFGIFYHEPPTGKSMVQ